LIANAMDACNEIDDSARGKIVTVKTRMLKSGGVKYQVVDNGCGLAKDIQDKIFQGFFSTKGTQGTGIGLMMTKKIVDRHGGTIEVDSQKGRGTTFTIKLPPQQKTSSSPKASDR
jgi:signal transduction histidine kinase